MNEQPQEQPQEPPRVSVQSDGRIEIETPDLVLVLEADGGLLSVLVFAAPRDVLLGVLHVGRDGVEVARTGQWRGTMVEWAG